MSRVENSDDAIDGCVFVQEIHKVDETGVRSQCVELVRHVLIALQMQITCKFRAHI